MRGSFSRADPYRMYDSDTPALRGFADPAGKTLVHPGIVAGEDTAVIVIIGQSNAGNHASGSHAATNASKVQNFNPYNGGVYLAVDPLLGCTGRPVDPETANWPIWLGDALINANDFDRVIFVNVAIAGTKIADWAPGGLYNDRVSILVSRLAAVGLTPTVILQHLGESDGTGGTSQAAFQASQLALVAQWRALGVSCPYLVGQSTWVTGTVNATVRAACAAVVGTNGIFAGADADSLNGTNRRDNTHWNQTGCAAVAALWRTKILAAL